MRQRVTKRRIGRGQRHKLVKQYIKLIARNANPELNQELIRRAPDAVVKAISNACLNAACGRVNFKPKQKKLLHRYRKNIGSLLQKDLEIDQRRKILEQKGGAIFLPLILSTVLSALGSALFR